MICPFGIGGIQQRVGGAVQVQETLEKRWNGSYSNVYLFVQKHFIIICSYPILYDRQITRGKRQGRQQATTEQEVGLQHALVKTADGWRLAQDYLLMIRLGC